MNTEYTGALNTTLSDRNSINSIFSQQIPNTYGCLQNEYFFPEDTEGHSLGIFKCTDDVLHEVPRKHINSKFMGVIKPRNIQQMAAIDLLYDERSTIKIITGKFGTGKDFLMCAAAADLQEQGKFERIVYVRNNIEVKDSKPIGFLPGSYNEKMLPFAMPLADHFGGVDALESMITRGVVEVTHLGFMRGRDITNSIIYCSEAENMTKEHIQLLIGRVGEGSALWINGDFKQCDATVFRQNNGLLTAIDKMKGHPLFGYIHLVKTERSETAAMADLLD